MSTSDMIRAESRMAIRANYDVLSSWFRMNNRFVSKRNDLKGKLMYNDIMSIENEDERLTCLFEYYFQNSKEFTSDFELHTSIIKKCYIFDEFAKQTVDLMRYHFEIASKNMEMKIENFQIKTRAIKGPKVKNPFTLAKIDKGGKTYRDLELDKYYDFDEEGVGILKKNLPNKKYYKTKKENYLEVKDKYNNIFCVATNDKNIKYFTQYKND